MKILKVTAAPAPGGPKTLKEALELAEKTGAGLLAVPQAALCLMISGEKVEVEGHGEK